MDLDPDKVVNDMNEAALQAEIMKGFQAPLPEGQGAPAGADVMDPTGAGGGTMGTGQVPVPGEQGFRGNGGQGTVQQTEAVGGQQPPMESLQ